MRSRRCSGAGSVCGVWGCRCAALPGGGMPRSASLAASWPSSWAAPMEDGAMYIPVGKDVTRDPVPLQPLLGADIHCEQPDPSPLARELPREAGYGPQPKHPVLGLSSLPGRCLPPRAPGSPSPRPCIPVLPRPQGKQGGHSSLLGRCKRICPLCPDNIVFVAEREEPASTR